MSERLKRVICVRALADDLMFLRPVTNRMSKLLGKNLKFYELGDRGSHVATKIALGNQPYEFAILFAHGGRDYLRGGEYQVRATGENIETEKFLTSADLGFFRDKVIFCMSCDSNGLARATLESGARAFVGFDKVPFNRFNENGEPIGSHVLVKHCQEILAESVKLSLERFLTGNGSLNESVVYLRTVLVKRAIEYVRRYKTVKERREVSALLLQTKNGLRYHGEKGILFEP